jgi:two-component system, LuxR family, response regulator FixJ
MNDSEPKQNQTPRTIYVVEQDEVICEQISALYEASSLYIVESYSCAEDFLIKSDFAAGCLIVNIDMPGMSTIDLLQALKSQGIKMPTIVLGEKDDLPKAVKVMQAGALDFISKPFTNQRLKISVNNVLSSIF